MDLNKLKVIEILEVESVKSTKNKAIFGLNQRTMLVFCKNGLSGCAVDTFYLFLNTGNKETVVKENGSITYLKNVKKFQDIS